MQNVLQVYECPNCGEVLEDEVYFTWNGECHCLHCNMDATPKRSEEIETLAQRPCKFFKLVDRKRWLEARGHYDPRRAS